MPVRDVGENSKLGKRDRIDYDGPRNSSTKSCREEPAEAQGPQDFFKTKCYNYRQMVYIKAQCLLSPNEVEKVLFC